MIERKDQEILEESKVATAHILKCFALSLDEVAREKITEYPDLMRSIQNYIWMRVTPVGLLCGDNIPLYERDKDAVIIPVIADSEKNLRTIATTYLGEPSANAIVSSLNQHLQIHPHI